MLNKNSENERESHPKNEKQSLNQHNKIKNQNFSRVWKPYKQLKYYEKRRLQDRESQKDHEKYVKIILT